MKYKIVALVLCAVAEGSSASDGDETLRFYLSKSQLVVLGTIDTDPQATADEDGVHNWSFKFSVKDVLQGDWDKSKTLTPVVIRFERDKSDEIPHLLKRGTTCILFLRNEGTKEMPIQYRTVDPWFGIQHGSPTMAQSLKRLAKAEKDK